MGVPYMGVGWPAMIPIKKHWHVLLGWREQNASGNREGKRSVNPDSGSPPNSHQPFRSEPFCSDSLTGGVAVQHCNSKDPPIHPGAGRNLQQQRFTTLDLPEGVQPGTGPTWSAELCCSTAPRPTEGCWTPTSSSWARSECCWRTCLSWQVAGETLSRAW